MSTKKPIIFVIVDGLGTANPPPTPYLPYLTSQYSHTTLHASGPFVGLLPSMPGNSMAGHLTLGAGRIIEQPITTLTRSLRAGVIPHSDSVLELCSSIAPEGRLHICALLSPSGVHGTTETLIEFVTLLAPHITSQIIVHAILDGRDSPPQSAREYLEAIETLCRDVPNVLLGSISGRFYALDRDKHTERTAEYVTMLITEENGASTDWRTILEHEYAQGNTDEFISPTRLSNTAYITPQDGVLIFITRADRARSLVRTLQQEHIKKIITATDYGLEDQPPFLIPTPHAEHTLLDVLEAAQYRLFTIAETEKYAHISYFFNGGREVVRPDETRVLIPSYPLRSHAERPEMRAPDITRAVVEAYASHDFFLINYANADMIGHTGDSRATHRAFGVLSDALTTLEKITRENNGMMIITSDHGNAEAIDSTHNNMPHTMHTHALVPLIVIANEPLLLTSDLHGLADVAPWLLRALGESVPSAMTGSGDILI